MHRPDPIVFIYCDCDQSWAATMHDRERSRLLSEDAVFLDSKSLPCGIPLDESRLAAVWRNAVLLAVIGEVLRGDGGARKTTTGQYTRFKADDSNDAPGSALDVLARWRGREAERPHAARLEATEPLTFLAVCDEWFPARGGISAFNRYLCLALATAGHTMLCLVPSSSAAERQDAEAGGVRLVNAPPAFGDTALEALVRKPDLPVGVVPNVVIGHSRFSGPAARVLVEGFYKDAARLHFVHVHPDRTEWGKPDTTDATLTSAQLTRHEKDLCEGATRTIAVGPQLHDFALSKLTYPGHVSDAVQIVPGFDGVATVRRARFGPALVMVLGRVQNHYNKGLDLAAKAIGHAITHLGRTEDDLEMYVRGVPTGEGNEVHAAILEWSGVTGLITSMRYYATDPAEVLEDLAVTSLLLMPAREEDFGLVGWEAIRAGVPVLVSARSGLGRLLRVDLPEELAARVVVDVRKDDAVDVPLWASRINAVLNDPEAAFDTAERVLAAMAERHTWAAAVRVVENAVRRG